METKFIECECHAEALAVTPDREFGDLYLAIYAPRCEGKTPWLYRLRAAWRVLRHGTPYADQIILSKQGARELKAVISDFLSRKK